MECDAFKLTRDGRLQKSLLALEQQKEWLKKEEEALLRGREVVKIAPQRVHDLIESSKEPLGKPSIWNNPKDDSSCC